MGDDPSEVVAELRELRRGRGLLSDDIDTRVGPRLRAVCGIADSDPPALVRRKLILHLTERSSRLPRDLRLAVEAALALHQTANHRFLHERLKWLADHYDRDQRTARRRIDEAFRILAEALGDLQRSTQPASPSQFAADGWYVESMKATLRLDVDPPRLIEERRIVATADELDEVVSALSVPRLPGQGMPPAPGGADASRQPPPIQANILHGGEIVEERRPAQGHARFIVRLPRPLALGERHEFGVEYVVCSRDQLRPYYAVTPLRRYDRVRACIRFGSAAQPAKLWKLNGVHPRVVDEFVPSDEPLTVDSVGEVRIEFFNLRQGLSYGAQWMF